MIFLIQQTSPNKSNLMKKLLFILMFLIVGICANAQNSVKFRIKNAGFTVPGYFSSFKPYVTYDKDNLSAAKFIGIVNINSINTNNTARDKHLKGADFFDEAKYQTMKFESTSVSSISSTKIKVTGTLTIKDVSKTVSFETTVGEKNGKKTFTSTFSINRLDYNVGESSMTLANILNIDLYIEK